MNKFGVHIKTRDVNKSYHFYKAFGFKPIFAYGSKKWRDKITSDFKNTPTAKENYDGVTFDINGSLLEVANGHIAVKPEVFSETVSSSKISAFIDVDSIDRIIDICKANNFRISVEPIIYPWGSKETVIKDLDNFVLVFREQRYSN